MIQDLHRATRGHDQVRWVDIAVNGPGRMSLGQSLPHLRGIDGGVQLQRWEEPLAVVGRCFP